MRLPPNNKKNKSFFVFRNIKTKSHLIIIFIHWSEARIFEYKLLKGKLVAASRA